MTQQSRRLALLVLSIMMSPMVLAAHDGDPLPDSAEPLVCGFPAVSGALNSLPAFAGRCANGDYSGPIFTPTVCPECSQATSASFLDIALTPAHDVTPVPLLPASIPSQGPFGTPPVDQPLGTVQGQRQPGNPQRYCVTVTPENSGPLFQCIDLGPIGPLLLNVGPLELVSIPGQAIGPTPGVPEGALGSTPGTHANATSMDVVVGIRWVESRLNQRLGPGLVNAWEPVDLDNPTEVQWWLDNGQKTTLDLSIVLKFDGQPQQTIEVHAPYVGQLAAALQKTTV